MASDVADRLWGLIEPYVAAEGVELDDVQVVGSGSGTIVRVMVDGPGPVDVGHIAFSQSWNLASPRCRGSHRRRIHARGWIARSGTKTSPAGAFRQVGWPRSQNQDQGLGRL